MGEGENQRRKSGLPNPGWEDACEIPQPAFGRLCVSVDLKKRETNDLTLEKNHLPWKKTQ